MTLVAALALAGLACAGAPVAAPRDPCGADEAFERGAEDASAGRAADSAWTGAACAGSPARAAQAESAYHQGHAAGLALREPAPDEDPGGAGGAADAAGAEGEHSFRCEVQARGEVFSAVAPTRAAAVAATRARCRERNGERYCRDVTCRREE